MNNPWREQSQVNPQRENGHRRISNEVFKALVATKMSGAIYQVILAVIDRTWGYDKPYGYISFAQFKSATTLSQQSISKAVQNAEKARIIVVERDGTGKGNKYLFNKHWDTWLTSQLNHTSQGNHTGTSQPNHTRTSQPLKAKDTLTTEKDINNYRNKKYRNRPYRKKENN